MSTCTPGSARRLRRAKSTSPTRRRAAGRPAPRARRAGGSRRRRLRDRALAPPWVASAASPWRRMESYRGRRRAGAASCSRYRSIRGGIGERRADHLPTTVNDAVRAGPRDGLRPRPPRTSRTAGTRRPHPRGRRPFVRCAAKGKRTPRFGGDRDRRRGMFAHGRGGNAYPRSGMRPPSDAGPPGNAMVATSLRRRAEGDRASRGRSRVIHHAVDRARDGRRRGV